MVLSHDMCHECGHDGVGCGKAWRMWHFPVSWQGMRVGPVVYSGARSLHLLAVSPLRLDGRSVLPEWWGDSWKDLVRSHLNSEIGYHYQEFRKAAHATNQHGCFHLHATNKG